MSQQIFCSFALTPPLLVQQQSGVVPFPPPNFHIVIGTLNVPGSSTGTVNLTNGAQYTSATTYAVLLSSDSTSNIAYVPVGQTLNSFQIINPFGTAQNFMFCCIGF